jgi:hypothetical protein
MNALARLDISRFSGEGIDALAAFVFQLQACGILIYTACNTRPFTEQEVKADAGNGAHPDRCHDDVFAYAARAENTRHSRYNRRAELSRRIDESWEQRTLEARGTE